MNINDAQNVREMSSFTGEAAWWLKVDSGVKPSVWVQILILRTVAVWSWESHTLQFLQPSKKKKKAIKATPTLQGG